MTQQPQRLDPEQLVARLATTAQVTPQQVRALLQAQAELAAEYARSDYPVQGIGVLHLIDTAAHSMVMRFGPKMGQTVEIPAKKKLTFRVCKMMKDVVFGNPKAMPDIFDPAVRDVTWYPPDYEPED